MPRLARLLGWLLLAALAYVTVCPIGLRPISNEPLWLERSAPYALLAALFCIGYPRHRLQVLVLTVAAAGLLEAAQALQPSRHPGVPDALVKAAGACAGWSAARIAQSLGPSLVPFLPRPAIRFLQRT
ncbi:hypothetical protein [Methylobacterium sp. A54F]